MQIVPSWNPKKYVRVLKYARNPTGEEMQQVSTVAGAGLLIIGLIGIVIFGLMSFIPF
jgi:protein transport protein SEC61 subunit gamma-like protein